MVIYWCLTNHPQTLRLKTTVGYLFKILQFGLASASWGVGQAGWPHPHGWASAGWLEWLPSLHRLPSSRDLIFSSRGPPVQHGSRTLHMVAGCQEGENRRWKASKAWFLRSPTATSGKFHRPKQVTGPSQIQESGNGLARGGMERIFGRLLCRPSATMPFL